MLDQITQKINTQTEDDPAKPLGTLQSGAALLAKALQSFPDLAEAAQTIAAMGGDESGEAAGQTGGKKYNGTVDFMGTPVEIKDGEGDDGEGNKVFVSPDGAVVADAQGKVMGRIENGKFVVIDKNQGDQLEQSKMAERSAT